MQSPKDIQAVEVAEPRRTRLGRQRQVVTTLTRHGFGLLVQRSPIPFPGRSHVHAQPESLRAALQELGTTFIKLGQILSTRSDILPDDYITALAALQDRLPPVGEAIVRATIERELGATPEALFRVFDPQPLATASIGQVHAAELVDGRSVVVKVQKPGIVREVELDLLILHDLAQLVGERIDIPQLQGLEEVVEQFSDSLREELDYRREARNAEHFARLLEGMPGVIVPAIHWDRTTSRVLTMDRIEGVKINDVGALARMHIDRRAVARTLAGLVLRQIFEWGFFHADPHPGNYLVCADGALGIIDFGLTGTLDDATRRDMLLLLAAWVRADADGLAESLVALGMAHSTNTDRLRRDMRRILNRYHDARLGEINFQEVLREIFGLARKHHLVLRGDLAMMTKTLGMHEGLGLVLDPEFRLVEAARPYAERALRHMAMPRLDGQSAILNLAAMADLTLTFPQRAQRLLARLERGDFGVAVRPEGVSPLMRDLNRMVNRLSVSILTAAFIVGLAVLLQVVEGSHGSIALLGLFTGGLVAAALLGLWLLVSMWRSGRMRL